MIRAIAIKNFDKGVEQFFRMIAQCRVATQISINSPLLIQNAYYLEVRKAIWK